MDPQHDMGHNVCLQLLEDELIVQNINIEKNYSSFIKHRIKKLFSFDKFIYHIHFPDWAITRFWPETLLRSSSLFLKFILLKLLAITIVRTVHDFGPLHATSINSHFHHTFQRLVYFFSDKSIFLSPGAQIQYLKKFNLPVAHKKKNVIIPISGFGDHYPKNLSKNEARTSLGIRDDAFVILLFGAIRNYKYFSETVQLFQKTQNENLVLLFAGRPKKSEINEKQLRFLTQKDDRILYHPADIEPINVQKYFKAADILLLPRRHDFCCGSGVLMLAFDFALPVIARSNSYAADLLNGSNNIQFTHDAELFIELENITNRPMNEAKRFMENNREKYIPRQIATQHIEKIYTTI